MTGAEIAAIATAFTSGGLTIFLIGWVRDTREKIADCSSAFSIEIGKSKSEMLNEVKAVRAEIAQTRENIERVETMIEPWWKVLCESLPGILKMRNSPDVVDYMLNGNPTLEELGKFEIDSRVRMHEAQESGNDSRALALTWLLIALQIKMTKVKRGE